MDLIPTFRQNKEENKYEKKNASKVFSDEKPREIKRNFWNCFSIKINFSFENFQENLSFYKMI